MTLLSAQNDCQIESGVLILRATASAALAAAKCYPLSVLLACVIDLLLQACLCSGCHVALCCSPSCLEQEAAGHAAICTQLARARKVRGTATAQRYSNSNTQRFIQSCLCALCVGQLLAGCAHAF
jgi:hypothetical protein